MAGRSRDSRGCWRVQSLDQHSNRRTLRPGKVNTATAEQSGDTSTNGWSTLHHAEQSGTTAVITRYSANNFNRHKPFRQIIKHAGLKPWPKLFQNLRSSCETDWLDSGMPAQVVANWIGYSVKVENDNYAQVDEHHFDQFSRSQSENVAQKTGETLKTAAKPCATECATGEQKTTWAIKKHGPKTVLHAPERSRTSTPITGT